MSLSRIVRFVVVVASVSVATTAWGQGFHALFSPDGVDVWAVGDAGLIHRSLDGGATWSTQTAGSQALRDVAALGFNVVLVGDNGEIRRSTDSGGSWTLTNVGGAPVMRGVEVVDASICYAVGDNGTILKSTDGGGSWSPQTSGTGANLLAVRCRDASEGWAVGSGGTVLHTTNGGANWNAVAVGTTKDLRDVDYIGSTVWIVGRDATARVSTNGVDFAPVNLGLDSRSDVNGVWLETPTTVLLTGGGGFIRKSTDGGATWSFFQHTLMAETSDLYFTNGGTKGWACSNKTKAVIRTTDSGANWSTNATWSRSWSQKQPTVSGTVRGSTIAMDGQNKNNLYVVLGVRVYKSTNRGETWTQIGAITGGGTKTNAFFVSPLDSMLMIAAVGTPDRISRSTDGGTTWTTTKTADFTEYGVPLDLNPDKPNELIFGPEDGKLWRTTDFGQSWSELSNPGFRSPCDIQIVHDDNNVIWVGDGVTGSGNGQMFRSSDGGLTFSLIYTGSGSEIPMIAGTRLRNSDGLATHWSSGGVRRTTDKGGSWSQVHTAGSAWGCDYAKDDPNVVVFGVYSGGQSYISLAGGASSTWSSVSLSGTNYAYYGVDRATLFAQQAAGVYKLNVSYTQPTSNAQSLTVSAPNGGEVWTAGQIRNVTWNASTVALARIEYRKNALSSWQAVADVAGYLGTYAWTVPSDATTEALIRVSDAWDANPTDASNATFTILAPELAAAPNALDYGDRPVGSSTPDSVQVSNTGTAQLDVSIDVQGAGFSADVANFSLAASTSRWVKVTFEPVAATSYSGTMTVSGNAPGPVQVALSGNGTQVVTLELDVPDGGESWQYNSVQNIQWSSVSVPDLRIEYQTSSVSPWVTIVASTPAAPGSYPWTIPNAPTGQARVRLLDLGGAVTDSSTNVFSITVPLFSTSLDTVDLGEVTVNTTASGPIYISNLGSAPLSISNVVDDQLEFHPGRTSFSVGVSSVDTVNAYYTPTDLGKDVATFTITADDPASPHVVTVIGRGVAPSDAGLVPQTFALENEGSNPFVGTTRIRYRLPERAPVTLEVFNLQGRRVAVLARGEQEAGEYLVPFGRGARTADGQPIEDLAAGVYFVRLQAGSFTRTYKLVLAR